MRPDQCGNRPRNTRYWDNNTWTVKDKGATTSVYEAIIDMWTLHQPPGQAIPGVYRMGCQSGTFAVMFRGISQALGKAAFDTKAGRYPRRNWGKFFQPRYVPSGDHANWVPGDWGYINNDVPDPEPFEQGENIIYLGGCFNRDVAQFKANAEFWGLCGSAESTIDTLENWIQRVNDWDESAELTRNRVWMKQ